MDVKNKEFLSNIGLLVIAIIWGFAFIAIKFTVDSIPPFYTISFRFTIASIILIIISFKKLKTIQKHELFAGMFLGLFAFFAYLFQNIGLEYTTASNSSFLSVTNVVMVPFLCWAISRVRPNFYQILAGIIVMVGVGFLSLDENFSMSFGDLITLGSSLSFSIHMIYIDKFNKKIDAMKLVIVQITTCAVLATVAAFLLEGPYDFNRLNGLSIFGILFLGIVSTLLTLSLQNICLKYTKPVNAALILSSQTIFATFFAIVILHELLTKRIILGCALIMAGIVICQLKNDVSEEAKDGNWTKDICK